MEQLDLAVDDTEIVLVLSMIFSWADGQVISDLFDRLEEKLNSLAAISWARFYRRLPEMMWISKRRTEKGMMMRIGRDTLPTSLSPRLAASMLFMENRVSDLTIFIRYLSEYDGGDESILTTLQSQAITFARASKTSWKKALEISKSTYKRNIAADVPSLTGKSKEMPLELARRVCDESNQYPLSVLASAESAIVAHVRRNIRPVAGVADEEHWFI